MTTLIEKKAREYVQPERDFIRKWGRHGRWRKTEFGIADKAFIAGWKACRERIVEFCTNVNNGDLCEMSFALSYLLGIVKTFGDEQVAGDEESNHLGGIIPTTNERWKNDNFSFRSVEASGITTEVLNRVIDKIMTSSNEPVIELVSAEEFRRRVNKVEDARFSNWVDATGVGP